MISISHLGHLRSLSGSLAYKEIWGRELEDWIDRGIDAGSAMFGSRGMQASQ